MSEHASLTDPAIHEPKGISTAANGTVYVATGSGSGLWESPLTGLNNANKVSLNVTIPDISTAGSVFVPSPLAGAISDIYVTLFGAITTADSIVTAKLNGVSVGGLSITCAQSGSSGGSTFHGSPSSSNVVISGNSIEIITDGGSSNTVAAQVTIVVNTA